MYCKRLSEHKNIYFRKIHLIRSIISARHHIIDLLSLTLCDTDLALIMASTSFLPPSDQCFSAAIETLAQLYSGNIEYSGSDFSGSSLLPDLTELEFTSSLDIEISHGPIQEERNYIYSPSVEIQSCYCPRPIDASNCTWSIPDESITAGIRPILTGRLGSEEAEPRSVSSGTSSDLRLGSTCSPTPRSTPRTDYGEGSLQIRQYSPSNERTRDFEKRQLGGCKDARPEPKWTATRQDVLTTDKVRLLQFSYGFIQN
jgi:hypothetical protein